MLTAFDTETTGLHLYTEHRMFTFSQCDAEDGGNGAAYREDETDNYESKLGALFSGDSQLLMHNAKFDLTAAWQGFPWLEHCKPGIWGVPFHDTMLMAAIVRNDAEKGLKPLAWQIFGYPTDDQSAIKAHLTGGRNYADVPKHLMDAYQIADVERTALLYHCFWPQIKANPGFLWNYQLERALIRPTMRMEAYGMTLDPAAVETLHAWLEDEIAKADEIIPAGYNHASPKDVNKWLYSDLGLPILKRSKKTKEASADKTTLTELLEQLQFMAANGAQDDVVTAMHAIKCIGALMMKRSYTTGRTTIRKYRELADKRLIIHPSINTHQALTGRESCSDPNLQNVAKPGKAANPYEVPARSCFKPHPGYVNFHVDYAGIEMVLAIQASKEPEMIDLLHRRAQVKNPDSLDPQIDPHALASTVFYQNYMALERGTMKVKRGSAKNGQFCVVYGGGDKKLAMTLVLPWHEGKGAKARYSMRFPKIMGLGTALKEELRRDGFITNSFGKRLYLTREKAHAVVNYRIQSDAGIIIKIAQVRVDELLQRLTGGRWRLVLPIHDEIIISAPREDMPFAKEILRQVREVMISIEQMVVPLEVEFGISTESWNKVEDFDIWDGMPEACGLGRI